MVFALEAVFARQGDALLLHYGSNDSPRVVLIDGGPGGVYGDHLRPRLVELREELGLDDSQGLPLELVMVTHSADLAGRADRVVRLRDGQVVADDVPDLEQVQTRSGPH